VKLRQAVEVFVRSSPWRRAWDWWTADSSSAGSSELPVRAAEWLAERRLRAPSLAMGGLILGASAVVGAIDALVASNVGAAVLWAPVVVLTIIVAARSATAACTFAAVAIGVASDRANDLSLGVTIADAFFRFLGLTIVALLASWAVLATVELARRSRTDPSTGLLNRAGFFAELERERERAVRDGTPLSLVYLDLDGLKAANDIYGHAHGDELLSRFATYLDQCRRIVDVAARLGGDEFALVLPGADPGGVQRVLGRLFGMLDADVHALSASAGAVTWASPPPAGIMLQQADEAMYQVKQRGGRSWVVLDLDAGVRRTARTA
jgi:diguanylate cyclase (GGDEF)-like protein